MTLTRHPPLPSAFDYLIVAPEANPFLLIWNPPGNRLGRNQVVGSGFSPVNRLGSITGSGGYSMHPGDQTENPQPVGVWHHVSVEPREALLPPGTSPIGIDMPAVESLGNRSSMLKARIKLQMGNTRSRDFDFDIGAGVEFDVCCYAVHGIDALVPDPAFGGITPEDVPNPRLTLATILTTAVYCGASKNHTKHPLTYTQSFVVGENGFTMPVMPAAREVIFMLDSSAAAPVDIDMIYMFTNPILPTNVVAPIPFVQIASVTIPTGSSTSPIVPIPGNVNAFTISGTDGTSIITVVQILNL